MINRKQTRTLLYSVIILMIGLVLFASQPLLAQDNPVSAQVDRTTIGSNETVTLSVIVTNGNGGQPTLPTLDGFQILGSSMASQFSMVNGKTSAQVSYQYTLQPTRTGELQIPSISVTVDGVAYTTEPITVTVTQGAAPSQRNQEGQSDPALSQSDNSDLFVEGGVDKQEVYLGQQITYIFRFYQAVNLFDQPSYQAPDFTGFWHEQKSTQTQFNTNIGGRGYQVIELQTILFPTVPGEQTIGVATLSIPNSIFQRGGILQTEPVTVTVKPLPEPAPADFAGAVGQIVMTTTLTGGSGVSNTVAVNEPVTLRIVLQGQGNAATWPDPVVPKLTGWRNFDSTTKTESQVQAGQLQGQRLYEQLLVATTPGDVTLPALTYTYFDPEQGSYQTLQSQPFLLSVSAAASEAAASNPVTTLQSPVTNIDSDIRHIKQAPTSLRRAAQPLTSRLLYWLAWGLPLLLVIGDWFWRWRRQRWANDPVLLRRSQAQKRARQALSQARKEAGDPHPVVAQVLSEYLSAKLNQPIVGLTQTVLAERLRRQGLENGLVEQINQLLRVSEMGRFAPLSQQSDGAALLTDTEQIIDNLEKVL